MENRDPGKRDVTYALSTSLYGISSSRRAGAMPSARPSRTIVDSRGSRTARSSRLISVGCRSDAFPSASCENPRRRRCARRFAANRSRGCTSSHAAPYGPIALEPIAQAGANVPRGCRWISDRRPQEASLLAAPAGWSSFPRARMRARTGCRRCWKRPPSCSRASRTRAPLRGAGCSSSASAVLRPRSGRLAGAPDSHRQAR